MATGSKTTKPAKKTTRPVEPTTQEVESQPDQAVVEATADKPKNWGPPYKAICTDAANGFEMGEDRRFKQRVFKFKDKPEAETLQALKEAGFTYRAEEKAWTIPATPATRELSDNLARQFAGDEPSRER
jgi:hypothetical protein